MLRMLGESRFRAGRWKRRDLLRAGGLGLLGGSFPCVGQPSEAIAGERLSTTAGLPGFGRAKQCLVLYIYGAWSQLDTFDPNPPPPADIRGEFAAIDSCLPGVQICEHLPRTAKILDRCTLVRSMAHPWNIH